MPEKSPFPAPERARFIEDLLGYMTVQEKAGQLVLTPMSAEIDGMIGADEVRRGRVGGFFGPINAARTHQLQQIATEESRLGIPLFFAVDPAAVLPRRLPPPISMAASWDTEAIEAAERLTAADCVSRGYNWAFSPALATGDYLSDNGFDQTTGEAAWLAAEICAARIRGLQIPPNGKEQLVQMLAAFDYVSGHLAGRRGQHGTREQERLRAILAAVGKGQPASIAIASNTEDQRQRNQVAEKALTHLRRPGGYEGLLLADWVRLGIKAGQAANGTGFIGLSADRIVAAVRDGRISAGELDDVVRRIIGAKFDLGLFRSSFETMAPPPDDATRQGHPARDLARKSIVLLRNDGDLLPLGTASGDLLVVGSAARNIGQTTGSARDEAGSVIDGLTARGIAHKFVAGLALREGAAKIERMIPADRMAIGMAGEAARRSQTVVVVMDQGDEVNGNRLGEAQETLLESLHAANPRLVLVTLGARPCDPDVAGERLPCVVHAGRLGSESGRAIADILSGEHAPSGHLPYAVRTRAGDERLPFGHGLTYGKFTFSEMSLELGADRILVNARLKNVGDLSGTQIVQLYLRAPEGRNRSAGRALLRGFRRIELAPGRETAVGFELGREELGALNGEQRLWVDAGSYEIRLGLSAARFRAAEIFVPQGVADAMNSGGASLGRIPGIANS